MLSGLSQKGKQNGKKKKICVLHVGSREASFRQSCPFAGWLHGDCGILESNRVLSSLSKPLVRTISCQITKLSFLRVL